jgi:hypothetical protein
MKLADLLLQYLLLKNAEIPTPELIERLLISTEKQILELAITEEISTEMLNELGVKRITFELPTQTIVLDLESPETG